MYTMYRSSQFLYMSELQATLGTGNSRLIARPNGKRLAAYEPTTAGPRYLVSEMVCAVCGSSFLVAPALPRPAIDWRVVPPPDVLCFEVLRPSQKTRCIFGRGLGVLSEPSSLPGASEPTCLFFFPRCTIFAET